MSIKVYALGSIAGQTLQNTSGEDFMAMLLDAGNYRPTFAGETRFAADGTPVTQILAVAGGRAFGVRLAYMTVTKLNAIVAAINTAVAAGLTFVVDLQDDLTHVHANCLPDFAAGWLRISEQLTN